MSKYGVFSDPYFPTFGLNTGRYGVSLHIQHECGKIRTTKNPYLDTFDAIRNDTIASDQETTNHINRKMFNLVLLLTILLMFVVTTMDLLNVLNVSVLTCQKLKPSF